MDNLWAWVLIIFLSAILALLVIGNDAKRHRELEDYEERWDRTDDWRG